jgi:hypothetical protein
MAMASMKMSSEEEAMGKARESIQKSKPNPASISFPTSVK